MIGLTRITFPKAENASDLHLVARELGVNLVHHTGGQKGWYDHQTRTISTRRGMSIAQYKCTLAHELGHAYHGDSKPPYDSYHARQEHRAWLFAAELLISRLEFERCAVMFDDSLPAIAEELEVTQHLLKFWLKHCDQHPA